MPYTLSYRKGSFPKSIEFSTQEDAIRYAELIALNPAVHTISVEGPDLLLTDSTIRNRLASASAKDRSNP